MNRHNYEPVIEVAEPGPMWVPDSHLKRLVVSAKVRVRLSECPLVGRWGEISPEHFACHQPEAHGQVGIIMKIWRNSLIYIGNTVGHDYSVKMDSFVGHYAAAELDVVED